jgi:hypothetical protein
MGRYPFSPYRPALLAHVRAGLSTKAFCIMRGLSMGNICRMIHAMGFRRYYLTEAEFKDVLARRQAEAQPKRRAA